jgi:glycyl-tRNA synthetase (class II)
VDYDSVGKGKHEQDGTTSTGSHVPTVTLRERDTMTQTRMTITELFDVVSLQH